MHRAGFGFVRIAGYTDNVFLPPNQMDGVLQGDRLRVAVRRERDGRYSGRVLKILERGVSALLGTVVSVGRGLWVESADRRLALRCLVPPADSGGAKPGDWGHRAGHAFSIGLAQCRGAHRADSGSGKTIDHGTRGGYRALQSADRLCGAGVS